MKKIIAFIIVAVFCSNIILDNNGNAHPAKINCLDTIPKRTDSSYALKQSAFHEDTTVTSHFDTLTANSVYREMDTINKSRADSLQKKKNPKK
jgi:hypothetical protein